MNRANHRPDSDAVLDESQRLVDSYADMILRISFTYLKSTHDAEDICQTIFLKLIEHPRRFHDEEHEKAWIIRSTVNACKDALNAASRKTSLPLDAARDAETPIETGRSDTLDAVMELKVEYREALYLHHFEGYSIKEIAGLTGRSIMAVGAHLSRGRKKLREQLAGKSEKQAAQTASKPKAPLETECTCNVLGNSILH